MAEKDFYEVLQVHPSAEQMVIEAAFNRLARKYHPDVYKGSNAHTRMVALNQAWEVLGNPARRKAYDTSRPISSTRTSGSSSQTTGQGHRKPSSARYGVSAPSPPNPTNFGIGADYWDNTVKGALAWRKRRKLVPDVVQTIIFLVVAGAGVMISACASAPQLEAFKDIAGFGWLAGIVVGYGLSAGVQQLHDAHLLRTEFNPRYNPNPTGYAKYAEVYAEYETEVSDVHVTRTGSCYHSRNYCCGTMETFDLPRFEAKARGYRPCSHCGYFRIGPKRLPPPFGAGRIPQDSNTL
jgi:curved DNA-binding protein CbpA